MARLSIPRAARPRVSPASVLIIAATVAFSSLALSAPSPVAAQSGGLGHAGDSVQGLRERASRSERRAEHVSRLVSRRLDGARVERRQAESRCLDQTLSEINAVRRMLDHHGRDPEAQNPARLRTVLEVLDERVGILELQAVGCESQVVVADGQTVVETVISADTPDIDPTVIPRPRRSTGTSGRPGATASLPPPGLR